MKDRLSDLQAATAEWLDGEMRGQLAVVGGKLDGLARQVGMEPAAAVELLKRWRRESRFRLEAENNARETGDREPLTYLAPEALVAGDSGDVGRVKEMMGWDGGVAVGEEQDGRGAVEMPGALAAAAGLLLNYFSRKLVSGNVVWGYFRDRMLRAGEAVESRMGAGEMESPSGPVEWLLRAVVVRDAVGAVVDVFPDARVRRRVRRKSGAWAVVLERPTFSECLNYEEGVRRMAAALLLYKGQSAGVGCQKKLAERAGVKKQSLNEMIHRLAGHYYRQTGGRAGFECLKN